MLVKEIQCLDALIDNPDLLVNRQSFLNLFLAEVLSVAEELNVNALFMSAGPARGRTTSFTEPES